MLTSRGAAAAVGGLVCTIAAWLLSLPELAAGGAAMLVVVLLSLLWVWRPVPGVPAMQRSISPQALYAGGVATVELSVRTPRRVGTLLLTEQVDDGRRLHVWAPPLRSGDGARGTFPLSLPDRGIVRLGPLEARLVDALGLASRRIAEGPSASIRVWPRHHHAPALHPTRRRRAMGADDVVPVQRWQRRDDEEVDGLRPYTSGDELRRIHWTASARGRGLMVRTSAPVGQAGACLVVDDRGSSHTQESFELALTCAAAIVGPAGDPRPPVLLRLLSGPGPATGAEALDMLAAASLWDDEPGVELDWGDDTDLVITGPTGHSIDAGRQYGADPAMLLRVDPHRSAQSGDRPAPCLTQTGEIADWPALVVPAGADSVWGAHR